MLHIWFSIFVKLQRVIWKVPSFPRIIRKVPSFPRVIRKVPSFPRVIRKVPSFPRVIRKVPSFPYLGDVVFTCSPDDGAKGWIVGKVNKNNFSTMDNWI